MADRIPLLPYNYYYSDPPALPIRQAGDTGGPTIVISAQLQEKHDTGVILKGTTSSGETVSIAVSILAHGIARVLLQAEQTVEDERVRLARELSSASPEVEQSAGKLTLRAQEIRVDIQLDPFHISFYDAADRLLLSQNYSELTNVGMKLTVLPFGFSSVNGQRVAFHDSFTTEPDEHFYGFGEKFTDFDKRGQRIKTWNYDCGGVFSERSYKNVPFFVSTRRYGFFVDSTRAVDFDMVASNTAAFSIVNPDHVLDYYVIAGPDLKTIISRYAELVSFPILPPKWSLGLWMSSGFQRDRAEAVLQRARLIRENNIPCDVLHLDCYWQRFGRWSELLWDAEMFPDPAGLIAQLKAMDFKVCLWINPYIGIESEHFTLASEKGYFLKNEQGETYVVDIWGGFHPPVGILDVTHPDAVTWFKDLLRSHLRIGIDVFKTDFGEGIPIDSVAHNGMSGAELHNLYALLYNDLVADVTAEETNHTGLVWGRSTYAGGQRHAAQWGGDANCTFPALASTLRGGLSMAMCGHAFWSHDIGGFTIQPTPELYIRWAQFGLLSPLTRAHGNTTRLPWDYGEEALRIFRDYTHLRYRLLPYIYTYACIAAETSLPLLRPMLLEFPTDPATYTLDLQYMFGEELLVAPIFNSSGERSIYLPEGRWIDFWTREVITGSRSITVRAPLDILPIYVRANVLIPTIKLAPSTSEAPFTSITVDAYLFEQGTFELRDSDGVTRISAALAGDQLRIEVAGAKQSLALRLLPLSNMTRVEAVYVNDSELPRSTTDQAIQHAWIRQPDGSILARWS
ncbi:MAG: alpha-xylosidase [Ktedonobacteraceae bacterium]|nr:alpha-xylosidase [Ktedonobacteraceae bacterium]